MAADWETRWKLTGLQEFFPAIVNDLSAWYSSVEKLRGLAEKTNATLVFGHDTEQMRSLRTVPEGSYS